MLSLSRFLPHWGVPVILGCFAVPGHAQQERHGRGYKAPPPTAEVTVLVEKAFNQKPFPNASVIFRAERDGRLAGNLETKTNPEGKASLDLLEVGSHVTVQVIANGFATYATEFDLTTEGKQLLVKLQRPRAQVSAYNDSDDRPAEVSPGIQEHRKGTAAPAAGASPTSPLQTTPPVTPPASTQPDATPSPAKPGNPQ
jgi:hypothetical protein